jgi:hypothetical protein
MLRAGALIYAIFISFLIGLSGFAIVFIAFASRAQNEKAFESNRLIRNARSGIELLMTSQALILPDVPKTIDLFGNNTDSVYLEKKSWGLFDIAISKAFSKNAREEKIVLIGSATNQKDSMALYLTDMDKRLSLSGETILKGNCYLPKAGIERAFIEGKNFHGSQFVDGKILKSEKSLPKISKSLLERIQNISEGKWLKSDSLRDISFLLAKDSLQRSFFEPTLLYTSSAPVVLDHKFLRGNMAIVSSVSITVKASSKLTDVLLYAPKIILEEDFTGSLQAFASDSLVAGKNCRLIYPSVLSVCRNKKSKDVIRMVLNEEATCLGVLFAWQDGTDAKKQVDISVAKKAIVYGQVFSCGTIDLKGSVYGSVFTNKFVLRTPSAVYENHLLDATIDVSKLPVEYAGIVIMKDSSIVDKRIAKWLD